MSVLDQPIAALSHQVARREVSPVEVVRASLERIQADGHLNAYALVRWDEAEADARRAEQDIARGRVRGPLHGLPIAIKDNTDTAGVRTTGGSQAFADRVPAKDAPVWAQLKRAGAILVGKTNLHEFAYVGPHPAFGAVHNPHRQGYSPGGSSSGSGAAVGARHVVGAIGTDTGGSVRQPAAFCGTVGHKPTPGWLPLDGIVPLSWTLDTVGFLTRTPADVGYFMDAAAPSRWRRARKPSRAPTAVGVVRAQLGAPIEPSIQAALDTAAARLTAAGARVETVDLPDLARVHEVHRVLLTSEAYAAHRATLERAPERYGPQLRASLLPGALLSAADYLLAQQARTYYARQVLQVLAAFDFLVLPVAGTVAPPLDLATGRAASSMDLTRWSFVANFVGLPALSIPTGFADGLPTAVQLMGPRGSDHLLLAASESLFVDCTLARAA